MGKNYHLPVIVWARTLTELRMIVPAHKDARYTEMLHELCHFFPEKKSFHYKWCFLCPKLLCVFAYKSSGSNILRVYRNTLPSIDAIILWSSLEFALLNFWRQRFADIFKYKELWFKILVGEEIEL